uniref:Uncharacterized protein n=1 Tax=Panagrellus redivivus TaxID=6233 RepID=A0A7E4W3E8_PANRE
MPAETRQMSMPRPKPVIPGLRACITVTRRNQHVKHAAPLRRSCPQRHATCRCPARSQFPLNWSPRLHYRHLSQSTQLPLWSTPFHLIQPSLNLPNPQRTLYSADKNAFCVDSATPDPHFHSVTLSDDALNCH